MMFINQVIVATTLANEAISGPFAFEFSSVTSSQGRAELILIAQQDLDNVELLIEGDEQKIRKHIPRLKAGERYSVTWKQAEDLVHYNAKLTAKDTETEFQFAVRRGGGKTGATKLEVLSSHEQVTEQRKVEFRTSFTLTSYEYKIYDITGAIIAGGSQVAEVIPAGGVVTISWDAPQTVFMIHVRGQDDQGHFAEYRVVPWSVQIPHTEVNFPSGKADILQQESGKIDEALAVAFHELDNLERVNAEVNAGLRPQLYIVGYTDTVGPTASNQKLSEQRARAIAQYFYQRGFWAEIYYGGMGETALRVATGDNVDEAHNRRALYILGVQPPSPGSQVPTRWQKLTNARKRPAGFSLPALPEKWQAEHKHSSGTGEAGSNETASTGTTKTPPQSSASGDKPSAGSTETLDSPEQAKPPAGNSSPPPTVSGAPSAHGRGCAIEGGGRYELALFATLLFLPLVFSNRRQAKQS